MARRRYLVMYDISDDRRLRRVHAITKSYGHALQLSVYVCDLSRQELAQLKWDLGDAIHGRDDRVAIVDLGDVQRPAADAFTFLGRPPYLPTHGPAIL